MKYSFGASALFAVLLTYCADGLEMDNAMYLKKRRKLDDGGGGFFGNIIDTVTTNVENFVVDSVQGVICGQFVPDFVQDNFLECPEDTPPPSISLVPSTTPTALPTMKALWDQIGGEVVGADGKLAFGMDISLDGTGETMIVSGNNNVLVLHIFYNEDKLKTWEIVKDLSGFVDGPKISVSLSYDTNSLAVGDPESTVVTQGEVIIFNNDPFGDAGWAEIVRVAGNSNGDKFGHDTSMANDGVRTAACAPGQYVRIFDLRPNSYWYLEIVGTPTPDFFCQAVAISGDGSFMVVGEYGDTANAGFARIYELDSFGVIQSIPGNNNGDTFGHAIALSNDARIVAVGTADNGYVKVYYKQSENSNTYVQVGEDVTVDPEDLSFGNSLSLSFSGTRLIVGAPLSDVGATGAGGSYVYGVNPAANSVNMIAAFFGESASDADGVAVGISGDGKTVANGSTAKIGGRGGVRAFGKYNTLYATS